MSSSEDGIEIIEIGLRPGEKMYEELLISGEQLPTKNPKIFKSMEKFPNLEVMIKLVDSIKESVAQDDVKKLILILKENVEGFITEK